MAPPKGKSNNPKGKPKGTQNKVTTDFKDAVNKFIHYSAPQMIKWLEQIEDPEKRLNQLHKFAEYAYPKLARTENVGDGGGPMVVNVNYPKEKS